MNVGLQRRSGVTEEVRNTSPSRPELPESVTLAATVWLVSDPRYGLQITRWYGAVVERLADPRPLSREDPAWEMVVDMVVSRDVDPLIFIVAARQDPEGATRLLRGLMELKEGFQWVRDGEPLLDAIKWDPSYPGPLPQIVMLPPGLARALREDVQHRGEPADRE